MKQKLNVLLLCVLPIYVSNTFMINMVGLSGYFIVQLLLVFCICYGVFEYLKVKRKIKPFSLAILLYVLMFAYWFCDEKSFTTHIKDLAIALLGGIPFYALNLKEEQFKITCMFVVFASLLSYYSIRSIMFLENENSYGGGSLILYLLPIGLFFFRNKKPLYIVVWCMSIFILTLTSIKRGDILCAMVSIIVYFGYIQYKKKGISIKSVLAIGFVIATLSVVLFQYMESSDLMQARAQETLEGNTSGRDYLIKKCLDYYSKASTVEQIFGGGFTTTWRAAGNMAHNDWVELLVDEGLISVLIYFSIYVSLFRVIYRHSMPFDIKAILYSIYSIMVISSLISMLIFSNTTILLFMMMGYIFRRYIRERNYIQSI